MHTDEKGPESLRRDAGDQEAKTLVLAASDDDVEGKNDELVIVTNDRGGRGRFDHEHVRAHERDDGNGDHSDEFLHEISFKRKVPTRVLFSAPFVGALPAL